jgi:hypothetical protein
VGGVVPGSGDDVIVAGPVQVAGTQHCQSLHVTAAGDVSGLAVGRLVVAASVENHGTIQDGTFVFYVELGGDLTSHGVWSNFETVLIGSSDHHLVQGAGATLSSDLVLDAAASRDVLVDTPFEVIGDVDVTGGRIILGPAADFTMRSGLFHGEILCNGNKLELESAVLYNGIVDAAVLAGSVATTSAVSFTGGVTVTGVFRNSPSSGNAHVSIDGGLVNQGVIQNDTYGFTIDLSGDLTNDADITCSYVSLDGAADHHLSMGPAGIMGARLFLPEFGTGTIIAETDLHFAEGVALGLGGTMILAPGSTVTLSGNGAISGGSLLANGAALKAIGTGHLALTTIDQAVLDGQIQISGEVAFTGGLTVNGTLQGWQGGATNITVDGVLVNNGTIRDNVQPLNITAMDDVENSGTMGNARVVLDGVNDQSVGIGAGIDVPEFVLESGLSAATFQWFRDGAPLPGETASTFTLVTVTPADAGSYHCVGDGSQVSRIFELGTGAVGVAPPLGTPSTVLEPNRPNPFRAATQIAFSLARAERVVLSVYNVAGRRVAVLVDGELPGGRHLVEWMPGRQALGAYFFRLQTGGHEYTVKGTRLR